MNIDVIKIVYRPAGGEVGGGFTPRVRAHASG
jgi:hypothetical protein